MISARDMQDLRRRRDEASVNGNHELFERLQFQHEKALLQTKLQNAERQQYVATSAHSRAYYQARIKLINEELTRIEAFNPDRRVEQVVEEVKLIPKDPRIVPPGLPYDHTDPVGLRGHVAVEFKHRPVNLNEEWMDGAPVAKPTPQFEKEVIESGWKVFGWCCVLAAGFGLFFYGTWRLVNG